MQTLSPGNTTRSALSVDTVLNLPHRPRRLRQSPAIRALVSETFLRAEDFVQPFFIIDGNDSNEDVPSMPGVRRLTINTLLKRMQGMLKAGHPFDCYFSQTRFFFKISSRGRSFKPGYTCFACGS